MSDGQPEMRERDGGSVRRIVTICNQRGLHARASARFVKMAAQFDADVTGAQRTAPRSRAARSWG